MSIRSRLAGLVLAAGAVASMGLAAAPAATAAPTAHQVAAQVKHLDLFGITQSDCPWGDPGAPGRCGISVGGHTPGWQGKNHAGVVSWSAGDATTFRFESEVGNYVEGTVPGRGSAAFTVTKFYDPKFGTLIGTGQKLNLVINRSSKNIITGLRTTEIYLNGDLSVDGPVSSTGGSTNPFAGLFGSS